MKSGSARAVVIKNNCVLLLHVQENNYTHFLIPGGKKESNEKLEETVIREVLEETSICVVNPIHMGMVSYAVKGTEKTHTLFLCEYVNGTPKLGESPEMEHMKIDSSFVFIPKWVPISEITTLDITPKALKKLFVDVVLKFK